MKNPYLRILTLFLFIFASHLMQAQACRDTTIYQQQTICQGQPIVFNGMTLDSPATYNDTIVLAGGCDSIISLQLFVIPIVYNNLYDTMCAGGTYAFYGQTLTAPGQYGDTLFYGNNFCDSVILLHLAVRASQNDTFRTSATYCATGRGGPNTGYNFYGQYLNTSGTYVHTASLPSGSACSDSVVILTLRVGGAAGFTQPVQVAACGASYDFYGRTLTTAGLYNDTIQSSIGCDSIISIYLTLNNTYYQPAATNATICTGGSYVWRGVTYTQASPGMGPNAGYKDTVIATSGCDTIFTLILRQVNNAPRVTVRDSFCAGSTYTYGTSTFTTSGRDTVYLASTTGCDTMVILTLTYKTAPTFTMVDSFCQGSTYTYRGNSYTTSGLHFFTVPAPSGCDSIIQVSLSYKAAPTVAVADSFCHGMSYTYRGSTFTTAGLHSLTFPAPSGCDTVVNLTLTYTTPLSRTMYDTICQGDTFTYAGNSFTTRGAHRFTVATAGLCDSLITLNLTVNQLPNKFVIDSFCQGTTYHYGTDSFTTAGLHMITVPASRGCDTSVTLVLAYKATPATPTITQTGDILVVNPVATSMQWYLNGSAISGATSQTYIASVNGVYSVTIKGGGSCTATSANDTLRTLAIGEVSASGMFKLYPNPSNGKFTIETADFMGTDIAIYDVLGRVVYQKQLLAEKEAIDMGSTTNGTYYLVMKNKRFTQYTHFVIAQ